MGISTWLSGPKARLLIILLLIIAGWGFTFLGAIGTKKAGLAAVTGQSWKQNLLWQFIANGTGFVAFEALIFLSGLISLNFAYAMLYAPGFLIAQFTAAKVFHEGITWNQVAAIALMFLALCLYSFRGRLIAG
jgi:hypothetical protein